MFCTPENLLVEISGALGMKRKPLSQLKSCFEKMQWSISETVNARAFKPLPLCSMHPWKLTSRDFWSSRNKRKPLSQLKHVLRKCCGVSQKQWVLEFSNLCHCVLHPWKLTSRDFWSSRNKRKPLSQLKHVLRKCSGVSQKWVSARAFKPLPLCSAPLKTY